MTGKASNVIPIDRETNFPSLGKINTHLINLFQEHFLSCTPDIFTSIIAYCARISEEGQNNVQIMRYLEIRNQLQKLRGQTEAEFNNLSETSFNILDNPEKKTTDDLFTSLSLIENSELEHDLAWQAAATKLGKDENYKYFLNAEKRLNSVVSIKTEKIPFGASKICENFSRSLEIIEIDLEVSQEILLEFSKVIKDHVYRLWQEIDQYLESCGLQIPVHVSTIQIPDPNYQLSSLEAHQEQGTGSEAGSFDGSQGATGNSAATSGISSGNQPRASDSSNQLSTGSPDNQMLETLAQKVISKVEGLLASPVSAGNTAGTAEITFVASIDLATTLTAIQGELSGQQACLYSLTDSIKSALEEKGVSKKLSARHNDLINFVGMLFEFILDDHELPDEVKKLIALLQIPVLKLTLLDESFLTNRNHPARELLNKMASAGMHTTLDTEHTDSVIQLIEKTVRMIIRDFSKNPNIFPVCIESFRTSLETIYNPVQQDEENPLSDLDQTLTNQVILSDLVSCYQIPDSISFLIRDVWLEVLDQAESIETDEALSWEDAFNTMEMLLWNLQPDNVQNISQEDWLHLKNMILEHLEQVEYSPFLTVEWMQNLNELIQDSQPNELSMIDNTNENISEEPFAEIVLETVQNQENPVKEIEEVEEVEALEYSYDVIDESENSSQETGSRSALVSHLNLSMGQWVEFIGQEGKQFKCQLSSVDEKQNRFVFVNSAGMKVAEKYAYELGSDIESGRIRVIDNKAFFDKALNKVMSRFLKF